MSEEQLIEKLIRELHDEVALMEKMEADRAFESKFFKLLELCIFSMLESDENFFALILIQMKRVISFQLTYAAVSVPYGRHFVLYINPALFLSCSFKEMKALIKHEVYHIISKHHIRARALKNMYSPLAINLAMDISVNQYLINLPVWSETIEKVRRSYNVQLKEEKSMEEYADEIQKALNKLKSKRNDEKEKEETRGFSSEIPDISTAHNLWENNMEIIDSQQIDDILNKMAANVQKGKIPKSIEEIIAKFYTAPEITWKDYLKRLMGTAVYGYKKTITRKDRRQMERLDLRGRLSAHRAKIVIAVDISGSVSDKEIESIMSEVFSIVKNYKSEIIIIECDDAVRRVYSVKNIREIKKKLNTRGSTKFSPVFEYMREKNMRNSVLIYFTDGLGEAELKVSPINREILWVLTGKEDKLSLSNPYGKVLRLSKARSSEKINMYEFIRNELKDTMTEWAK